MNLPTRRIICIGLLLGGSLGCVNDERKAREQAAALAQRADRLAVELGAQPPADKTGVVVQLAFEDEADLDLYVTDPLLETVYFARHESRTGGRIVADVRCDTAGPRIEEVRFDTPWPGRYRVGVDHPRSCDGASAPAAYAITVHAEGEIYHTQGHLPLAQFEVIVLEFDVKGRPVDVEGNS